MTRRTPVRWALGWVTVAGCAAGAPPVDPAPCDVTWENYAQGFFIAYCQTCHATTAPDRHGAPADVAFDTEAQALRHLDAIRATVLDDGARMPPGGGLTDDELGWLAVYLDCQTPGA